MSYQVFPNYVEEDLPFSDRYKFLNCSYEDFYDLPDLDFNDFSFLDSLLSKQTLISEYHTPDIDDYESLTQADVDVSQYLPTCPNNNRRTSFLLLRMLKLTGNWDRKEGY